MGSDFKINNKVVFYDGYCVVCSRFINLLVNADKKKQISFSNISSNFSKKILKGKLKNEEIGKFIVFLSGNKVFVRSNAVIQIFIELGGFYKSFYLLKILPQNFRDFFYELFANNRYKWFGKMKECHMPSKELSDRFINE